MTNIGDFSRSYPFDKSSVPSALRHDALSRDIMLSTSGSFLSSRYTRASFTLVLNHSRSLFAVFKAIKVISYICDRTSTSVEPEVIVSRIALIASKR